jgi:hypothetical protein
MAHPVTWLTLTIPGNQLYSTQLTDKGHFFQSKQRKS